MPYLAHHDRADVAERALPGDRLPGHHLLLGAQERPSSTVSTVDPEIRATFEKLGIPLEEQKLLAGVAVDAVFLTASRSGRRLRKLAELGIIFCSFSEAVQEHPDLVRKYSVPVVPCSDNFFATLNSAVFSDGSFAYIPKASAVRWSCPPISSSTPGTPDSSAPHRRGGAHVSYLEAARRRCGREIARRRRGARRARQRDDQMLDDPELVLRATSKARAASSISSPSVKAAGVNSKITWTSRPGPPSRGNAGCILQGDNSIGEFYSVATTNNWQQADTGTKMIHIGRNTKSTIVSRGSRRGTARTPRHGEDRQAGARRATTRSATRCSSAISAAPTRSVLEIKNTSARVEHEASTSKIDEDQIFYCRQRGLSTEDAVNLIVSGFCREVFRELPMEFAVEAQKLLSVIWKAASAIIMTMLNIHNTCGSAAADRFRHRPLRQRREVHAIMGPNGSGKEHARARAVRPPRLPGDRGRGVVRRCPICSRIRHREGVFMAFQSAGRDPGVNNKCSLKAALNAIRTPPVKGSTPSSSWH